MNTKDLMGLMEAYSEVYVSQEELDEAEGSYGQTPKARTAMGKLLMARREKPVGEYGKRGEKTRKVKAAEKHTRRMDDGPDVGNRGKRSTSPRWSGYLGAKGRGKMDQDSRDWSRERDVEYSAGENKPGSGTVTKNPKKLRKQRAMGEIGEQVDIYDIILSHLLDEGYADTEDAATAIMVNMSEEWRESIVEEILDEAEGSYGQTPKARTAMGKLAIARREKPVGEYGKRGEKTKKVKEIEKHTRRIDNGPDAGHSGKKSTSPRWSGYLGAKGRGKLDQDSRDWSRERDVEYSAGENKPGSGTVTKNPKKLRKQRAMGEID